MPLYTYQCESCGTTQDAIRPIKDHKNGPECCNRTMKQIITKAPMAAQVWGGHDFPGYRNMVTGEYVTTRARHRDILKEHDLVEVGNEHNHMKDEVHG